MARTEFWGRPCSTVQTLWPYCVTANPGSRPRTGRAQAQRADTRNAIENAPRHIAGTLRIIASPERCTRAGFRPRKKTRGRHAPPSSFPPTHAPGRGLSVDHLAGDRGGDRGAGRGTGEEADVGHLQVKGRCRRAVEGDLERG